MIAASYRDESGRRLGAPVAAPPEPKGRYGSQRLIPLFLNENQVFLNGAELKADLKRLDDYYALFPEEVRERGVMSFAAYPPREGEYLVTRLWDRFLPKWREQAGRERKEISKESEAKIVAMLKEFKDKARPVAPGVQIDAQSADQVMFQRRVPMHMGKWRLLPPKVEQKNRMENDGASEKS